MLFTIEMEAQTSIRPSKVLKTHAFYCQLLLPRRRGSERYQQLQAPALEITSYTRTQLRPTRPHARHARNENEDETKPISRLRGVGQAGLAPPNLRFITL